LIAPKAAVFKQSLAVHYQHAPQPYLKQPMNHKSHR